MNKTFISILILFFSLSAFSQNCAIGALNVSLLPCGSDGKFSVTLNFNYENTGNEGFTVQGNGNNYGTFQYNALPITLGPFVGNGTSIYELAVKDKQFPDCHNTTFFGPVQCNACHLYDLAVTPLDCTSDSTYSVLINFNHDNTGNNKFDLIYNGTFFGTYFYSQLPLTIDNLPVSTKTNDLIKVVDTETESCYVAKEYPGLKCGNNGGDCSINELNVTKGDCTSDSTYVLIVNFNTNNPGSPKFDLKANGSFFGTYFYTQLPLTITNFPKSGGNVDWVMVCDHELADCCKTKEFETKACGAAPCHLYDITVTSLNCTSDSTYSAVVDFKHDNTGNNKFDLIYNGTFFGTYFYSQLPLTINNLPVSTKTNDLIKVVDTENEACFVAKEYPGLKCGNNGGDCSINELNVTKGDCTSDSTYTIVVNFNSVNPGSPKFDLKANGTFFGTYFYTQLPLTITNFPKSGGNVDWVMVCDHELANCCKTKEFETKNCGPAPCHLYDIVVTPLNCTSDSTYSAVVDFKHDNTGNNKFDLIYNGTYFGTYFYSQLPLTITNLPVSTKTNDLIKVVDTENEACFVAKEYPGLKCGNNGGDCNIYDLAVTKGDCTSDSTYVLNITFKFTNPGSAKFDLTANGQFFGTYLYSQLPLHITNFPKSGGNVDWIKVCDHELKECCKSKEFETKACGSGTCSLYDLLVLTYDCTSDSTYKVVVNFKHIYTMSNSFDLYANGKHFGYYQYSQLPITINNFPASGNKNDVIKVSDNDNPTCFAVKEFTAPECNNQNCSIYDLTVNLGDCNSDSTYNLTLNFKVKNPQSNNFKLWANGNLFGTYPYSSLPKTINNFPNSGNNNDVVKVCDSDIPDCCKSKEFKSPKCGGGMATIYGTTAKIVSCNNGKFEVEIDFRHHDTGNQGYTIMGNGNNYGSFPYSETPKVLGPFVTDFFTQYEYIIVDNQMPVANDYYLLGYVDCVTATTDPLVLKNQVKYHFEGQNLMLNSQDEIIDIQAFNAIGQLIRKSIVNDKQSVLDTSNWIPGMYVLVVRFIDGHQSILVPKLR